METRNDQQSQGKELLSALQSLLIPSVQEDLANLSREKLAEMVVSLREENQVLKEM